MSDRNTIQTYSRYFLYYLQPDSFTIENVDAKCAYTRSAKSACIRGVYVKSPYTKSTTAIEYLRIYLQ